MKVKVQVVDLGDIFILFRVPICIKEKRIVFFILTLEKLAF